MDEWRERARACDDRWQMGTTALTLDANFYSSETFLQILCLCPNRIGRELSKKKRYSRIIYLRSSSSTDTNNNSTRKPELHKNHNNNNNNNDQIEERTHAEKCVYVYAYTCYVCRIRKDNTEEENRKYGVLVPGRSNEFEIESQQNLMNIRQIQNS